MSYQSKYTGQEIDNKLDKVGEIGVLDSLYCGIVQGNYTPVVNEIVPFIKKSGNMNITDGKITINPGKRVQIDISLSFYNSKNTFANVAFYLKDLTNDIKIQKIQPSNESAMYEYPDSVSIQYTNETNKDCEIGLVVDTIYKLSSLETGNTTLTVHEIGRAMVVPSGYKEVELLNAPVEYDMTHNVLATIGKDLILNDDIANYNEVVFLVETKNTVNEAYLGLTNIRMLTSEIIYSNDDTANTSGSSFYLTLSHGTNNSELNYWRHCTAGVHFKTGTILRVRNTITNTSNYTKFRIKAIKGIKY